MSSRLPVESVIPELKDALRTGPSAVLQAPPGAGKTTRVPLALLDEPWLRGGRIVMLEPRRLATRAVARYMARQLGEDVSGTVGYHVRRDSRVGPRTRVEVVTEGILTRILQADPTLDGIGLLIFDEFHERSIHADLGLALALQSQLLVRPELRILVMSATLDGTAVASVLGDAPIIVSEGRSYPVALHYMDRSLWRTTESAVAAHVERALAEEAGDVLVFLPGGREIRRVAALLERSGLPRHVRVTPLYGDLPQQAQDAAIAPAALGERKVVLATSIAETSLTIEGVSVVIDSGLARVPRFSPRSGMSRLETVRVSRSSADQRSGRAGRVRPGSCYRLWPEHEQHHLLPRATPEILQADLAPLALDLAAAGVGDPAELRWLDRPPAAAYEQARSLLTTLGALDRRGRITPRGREMAALPTHPRIAHMILTAKSLGMGSTACDIAALLNERDILRGEGMPADADIRLRLDVLRDLANRPQASGTARGTARDSACGPSIDVGAARHVLAESAALGRQLGVSGRTRDHAEDAGLLLALAYPDRIARRRSDDGGAGRFLLRNGGGATLTHPQVLSTAAYIVAAELDGSDRDARIFLAAPLRADDIGTHFADQIDTAEVVEWDSEAGNVRARRTERLGAIVLRESRVAEPDRAMVASVLAAHIRTGGAAALQWSDAAHRLRERIAFVHGRDAQWPSASDELVVDAVGQWLVQNVDGKFEIDNLAAVDVAEIITGMLDWRQRAELDRLAPSHYTTPAGSRIAIDYADVAAPSVSVRLQEMFGAQATPAVYRGEVLLTVRLLSPAHRPVQVTRDLAGFWRGSYFEVRKELKGRYPKHAWPDDPLSAPPTSRAKRRGD